MSNGQFTTLTRANNTCRSLRTTVPASIVRQFDLKEGNQLRWRLEPNNDKINIIIEPVKTHELGVDPHEERE